MRDEGIVVLGPIHLDPRPKFEQTVTNLAMLYVEGATIS